MTRNDPRQRHEPRRFPRDLWHPARTAGRALVDLVFPPRCAGCGAWGTTAPVRTGGSLPFADFCSPCCAELGALSTLPCCPHCGSGVSSFELSQGRCATCRERGVLCDGLVRCGPYRSGLRTVVRGYKYHGRELLEPALGGWLGAMVEQAPWIARVDAVLPVPTHWRRRLTRAYYPPEALAAHVSRQCRLPRADVLRRIRAGSRQIGLSFTDRVENVRGAFTMVPGAALQRARLLLIDDVRTTGATLGECVRVLRRAGAAEVFAAVVAVVDWTPGSAQYLDAI
ncbi:MAG: ComF family protein [Planctomycetes bacterium]|nr:ComF family protein [Planctomycetota bacterium]